MLIVSWPEPCARSFSVCTWASPITGTVTLRSRVGENALDLPVPEEIRPRITATAPRSIAACVGADPAGALT
ncbi:hypothetical protein C8D88_103432 [Lentzea atacamensis]|uniref:Uncharacterized protein n=1 Tax=Lentzea atacamensis TaxID=531938 RepID=A0A316I4B4_9PSEU|nr:hypothetical protein C8D88_103432 [Lentzea atacamensis]